MATTSVPRLVLAGVLAVAVSAAAGAFVSGFGTSSSQSAAQAAGADAMAMLRDEHALVSDRAAAVRQAQLDANREADQEFALTKLAGERAAAQKLAAAEAILPPSRPRRSEPHTPEEIVGPPLELASMMAPAPVQPAPRPAGNFVIRQAKAVVETVERIPSWMRDATDWVVDLPSRALPRWPQRFVSL
jgi:hypothetical protein